MSDFINKNISFIPKNIELSENKKKVDIVIKNWLDDYSSRSCYANELITTILSKDIKINTYLSKKNDYDDNEEKRIANKLINEDQRNLFWGELYEMLMSSGTELKSIDNIRVIIIDFTDKLNDIFAKDNGIKK